MLISFVERENFGWAKKTSWGFFPRSLLQLAGTRLGPSEARSAKAHRQATLRSLVRIDCKINGQEMRRTQSAAISDTSSSPTRTEGEELGRKLYYLCKCGQWAGAHQLLDGYWKLPASAYCPRANSAWLEGERQDCSQRSNWGPPDRCHNQAQFVR